MKVLAIDPGYGRCGMAVLERGAGGKDVLLFSQCTETPATMDFNARLSTVAIECKKLIDIHKPDCLAMEKLYFSANTKTAMRVAEVRGAILSLAGAVSLPVFEYTPGEVKSAAAGHGGAHKKQIAAMLHALVKISKPIRHDDEYDAIAVGVTHLAHSNSRTSREAAKAIQ